MYYVEGIKVRNRAYRLLKNTDEQFIGKCHDGNRFILLQMFHKKEILRGISPIILQGIVLSHPTNLKLLRENTDRQLSS